MKNSLENFPLSTSARRMLSYVTKGWYDRSYVGKWVYEVMGQEVDLAEKYVKELSEQLFVDTATWGLMYHEMKYGLPVREDLSVEERRRIIRIHIETKAPMNPWRMEQIIGEVAGRDVHVVDCNDVKEWGEHPNVFHVEIPGASAGAAMDVEAVLKKIHEIKQSHTVFSMRVQYESRLEEHMGMQHVIVPNLTIETDKINFAYFHEHVGMQHVIVPNIVLA